MTSTNDPDGDRKRAPGRYLIAGLLSTWLWLAVQAGSWALGAGSYRMEVPALAFATLLALASLIASRRRFDQGAAQLSRRALAMIITGTVCAAYWWIWTIGYLSDDYALFRWAREHDFFTPAWEHTRPIPLALWALIIGMGGGSIAAHILSLLLHALNAFGVSRLASGMGLDRWLAAVTGMLFALWPLGSEPVAWLAATPDLIVTAAVISSTLILLSDLSDGLTACALLATTSIACFAKESGVIVPVVAAVLANATRGQWVRTALLAPAVSVAVAYAAYRLATAAPGFATPLTGYDIKEFVVRPFEALLAPARTSLVERARWSFALANLFLTACLLYRTIGALRQGARVDPFAALLAAVLITVAPLQRYLYVSEDLEGARYLYCAAVPWTLLVGIALSVLPTVNGTRLLAAALATLLAATILRSNLRPWFEAATLRDLVVARTVTFSKSAVSCPEISVVHIPESVLGAQVFRNGLREALADLAPPIRLRADAPPACTLELGFSPILR